MMSKHPHLHDHEIILDVKHLSVAYGKVEAVRGVSPTEIAGLCDAVGADVHHVRHGVGSDHRGDLLVSTGRARGRFPVSWLDDGNVTASEAGAPPSRSVTMGLCRIPTGRRSRSTHSRPLRCCRG